MKKAREWQRQASSLPCAELCNDAAQGSLIGERIVRLHGGAVEEGKARRRRRRSLCVLGRLYYTLASWAKRSDNR